MVSIILKVAHLHARTQMRAMRRHGHGFLPARHDDFRIAGENLLHAERNRPQTGAA
jgi:hypothetical protein